MTPSPSETVPAFSRAAALTVHSGPVNTIAISPDGKLFASGGEDACLFIFSASTFRRMKRLSTQTAVQAVVWHPGQPELITYGTSSGAVHTINHQAAESYVLHERLMGSTVYCLSVRFDGRYLAIGFGDEVAIARMSTPFVPHYHLPRPPAAHGHGGCGNATAVLFHNTDHTLVFVSFRFGRVSAFSYSPTDHCAQTVWTMDRQCLSGPASLSPSSNFLASLALHGQISRVHVADGRAKSSRSKKCNNLLQLRFISEDTVAIGAERGDVDILRLGKRGGAVQTLQHNGKLVLPLAHWHDESRGYHILITGTSQPNERGALTIWKAGYKQPPSSLMRISGTLAAIVAVASVGAVILSMSGPFIGLSPTRTRWFDLWSSIPELSLGVDPTRNTRRFEFDFHFAAGVRTAALKSATGIEHSTGVARLESMHGAATTVSDFHAGREMATLATMATSTITATPLTIAATSVAM